MADDPNTSGWKPSGGSAALWIAHPAGRPSGLFVSTVGGVVRYPAATAHASARPTPSKNGPNTLHERAQALHELTDTLPERGGES